MKLQYSPLKQKFDVWRLKTSNSFPSNTQVADKSPDQVKDHDREIIA